MWSRWDGIHWEVHLSPYFNGRKGRNTATRLQNKGTLLLACHQSAGFYLSVFKNATMDAPSQTKTVGSLQSPSAANLATLQSYRPLLSDYGPPSLGFSQGSSGSQVPQNKYAELLAIIEELGKEIRPTYAGSKSAMERLKRGIIHARGLVRECLAETERNARS
ncbi:protein strawberry notch homolog 1 isoform 4-T5 [Spinachia spinachia]